MRRINLPSWVLRLRSASWRVRAVAGCALVAGVALAGLGWLRWSERSAKLAEIASPGPRIVGGPAVKDPRPTRVVSFNDGCLTAGCHTELSEKKFVHAPVFEQQCGTCHQADIGGHRYPLVADVGSRCTGCHEFQRSAASLHAGRPDIACTECHDAHASEHRYRLASEKLGATCAKCHPQGKSGGLHAALSAERCELCHTEHVVVRVGLSTGAPAQTCEGCHTQRLTGSMPGSKGHQGLKNACLACHEEHSSGPGGRASADKAVGCLNCHQDIGRALEAIKGTPDAAITTGSCLQCHDPHAPGTPFMLRQPESKLCLGCHAKPVTRSGGGTVAGMSDVGHGAFVHGPIAQGRCGACHTGHGGRHTTPPELAAEKTPVGRFNLRNYSLCFSCHDKSLVLDEGERATAFRSGDRNLHKLHVQAGERSRSCGSCHEAHEGPNPRLLADTASYDGSDWKMKLGFTLNPRGGSCAPGCHVPMSYTRDGASGSGGKGSGGAGGAGKPPGGKP